METLAVLFDMDGLLLDTERLGMDVCKRAGRAFGYDVTDELVLRTLGCNTQSACAVYSAAFPGFQSEPYWAMFSRMMAQTITQNGAPVKPYARELLETLRARGVRRAVVSSSRRTSVTLYLDKAGLLPYFDCMVCGDQLVSGKPAPDCFLTAARMLDVPISRCIVLEDSPNGLMAGRASGARVYMVPDLIPFTDALAPYCDGVLRDLSQVEALL